MPGKITNLGTERTSFIARERELEMLRAQLAAKRRLITLVGAAGSGKTRVARRFGAQLEVDTVWFCDLSLACEVEPAALLLREELAQLELGRPSLLILDNFEQLLASGGAVLVEEWLERAPNASFLVTSRHPLHLPDEVRVEVPPLEPAAAVQLFIERALEVAARWEPSEHLAEIEELVLRLDCLPLAIELAAARMSLLSVSEILRRLSKRFAILQTSRLKLPERQSTMRAAIAWSWDLLEDWEQRALVQCSVFAGPFSLEDAEAVLDLSTSPSAPEILEVMQALRDKSVLRAHTAGDGRPGFAMLECVTDYVRSFLDDTEELSQLRVRHAEHYVRRGERVLAGTYGSQALRRTEELAGLAAPLWSVARTVGEDSPELAARAALILDSLLALRGLFESRLELTEVASSAASTVSRELEAEARVRRAAVLRLHGRLDDAVEETLCALPIARASAALPLEARALRELGLALLQLGRLEESRPALTRSLEIFRETRDAMGEAYLLGDLGALSWFTGDLERARRLCEAALMLHRDAADLRSQAILLGELAHLDLREGQLERAVLGYENAIVLMHVSRDDWWTAILLGHLGHARFEAERFEDAEALYRQAIATLEDADDPLLATFFTTFLDAVIATRDLTGMDEAGVRTTWVRAADHPVLSPAMDGVEGLLELAEARSARARGEAARARRLASGAEQRLADGERFTGSPHVLAVQRILRAQLSRYGSTRLIRSSGSASALSRTR